MENYICVEYNKHWEEYLVRNSKRKRLFSSWGDDTEMESIEIGCGDMECIQLFAV
jgi:uncharacterized protein YifE (UPF0438 family)